MHSHDAERALNAQTEQCACVARENITDVSPVDRVEQMRVRGVRDTLLHVQQAAHQHLQFCRETRLVTIPKRLLVRPFDRLGGARKLV